MKKYLLTIASIGLIAYVIFQGRYLIFGPQVHIDKPKNGTLVESGVVEILGRAINISYLSLNDRQIYIDTQNHFKEKLIAYKGRNIIKILGKDRFGREEEVVIQLVAK